VPVSGSVVTPQNLVDEIYQGLLEKGLKNGTLFGVNV
jgi:hypothetical protein